MRQYCLFPMKFIRITQRYIDGQHNALDIAGEDTGIDYWYAPCDLKVLAINPPNTNSNCVILGTLETVMCGDGKERILTFALSHMNISPVEFGLYVGKVIRQWERCYMEGTKGTATGNHIHMEVAEGWQYGKKYQKGQWLLTNAIDPAGIFVRKKGLHTVLNLNGYTMKEVDTSFFDESEVESVSKLIQGKQTIKFDGQTIYVYGQKDGEDIGLISTPNWKETRTLDKITHDGIDIHAAENISYFENHANYSEYGQVYGREIGFTEDNAPEQDEWYDLAIKHDNTVVVGKFKSWEYRKPDVKVSFSPACIVLYEGKDVTWVSSAAGMGKYTTKNTQTMLLQDSQKRFYFAVTDVNSKLDGEQCRAFAKEYGMTICAMGDSGGSSQLIIDGVKVAWTGRKLPNALALYTPKGKPEEGDDLMFYFKVAKATYTINGKGAIATRATATSKYDTSYPLYVGEVFAVTGDPVNSKGEPVYKIATGPQAGRWVIVESTDMKNGYLIPVVKP